MYVCKLSFHVRTLFMAVQYESIIPENGITLILKEKWLRCNHTMLYWMLFWCQFSTSSSVAFSGYNYSYSLKIVWSSDICTRTISNIVW